MAEFKVGDRVRLVTAEYMAAPVGAEATVVGHRNPWVTVEWDRKKGVVHTQMNGNYSPSVFELVTPRRDTPKVGDTVRVVLEGEVTGKDRPSGRFAVSRLASPDNTKRNWIYPDAEHVKSVEIIKPAKPSVDDLPAWAVVKIRETGEIVQRQAATDKWLLIGANRENVASWEVDRRNWVQLVEKDDK